MIDTGANISIIDQLELDRITELTTERMPTLPINNLTIIGATGKQNKTIRKQVFPGIQNCFQPVSYTHLDVYKRQAQTRSIYPFVM